MKMPEQSLNSRMQKYFEFYNNARIHQGLGYKMPAQVYFGEAERLENAVRDRREFNLSNGLGLF